MTKYFEIQSSLKEFGFQNLFEKSLKIISCPCVVPPLLPLKKMFQQVCSCAGFEPCPLQRKPTKVLKTFVGLISTTIW